MAAMSSVQSNGATPVEYGRAALRVHRELLAEEEHTRG
ncbi:DUF6354 family protein [Streptomyces sp. NPDC058657]